MASRTALRRSFVGIAVAAALGCAWAAGGDGPPAPVRYDRDVRPILSDRCFRCHGPEPTKRQANLRLDTFEGATGVREGRAAIVPGSLGSSLLWRKVTSSDPREQMPPPSANKKPLSSEELALVKRWIEDGARYEPHWSFVAPVRPPPPEVARASWPRNAIDRFVLARLEERGLAPSPEAEPAALLRRAFLDLTGLPPTPEELDRFLADARPERFELWVDALLRDEPYASRYAERMAVPWLDSARYADTCGIHMDAGRSLWPWRDWVLAAYRDDLPFDRFLTEQLAGDLLPGATGQQRVASGFNRAHVTSDEGGALSEEYLVEYAVDRTATTGAVFLGLTLGCARCHEHKFDPVSQDEFYDMFSFFDSLEEPGVYSQLPDAQRAFEPFMEVPSAAQEAQLAQLRGELEVARAELQRVDPAEEAQRAAFAEGTRAASGVEWAPSELVAAESSGGAELRRLDDGSALAGGANPDRDEHVLTLRTDATGLRLVLVEALLDPSLHERRVGRAPNGNAVLSEVEAEAVSRVDPARRAKLRFEWAWATHEQRNGDFAVVNAIDGRDDTGWAVAAHEVDGPRAALLLADEPFGFEGGTELVVRLRYRSPYAQHAFGRTRVRCARLAERGLDLLPLAQGRWRMAGPFAHDDRARVFATDFGPERDLALDPERDFGEGRPRWRFDAALGDGELFNGLPGGVNATYLGRRVFAPSARAVEVSLGSDDGFRLFVDGAEVARHEVDRGAAADQERATLELARGAHTLVYEVVNTGGTGGFYWKTQPRAGELGRESVAVLWPAGAAWPELEEAFALEWRMRFSPSYAARSARVAELAGQLAALEAQVPRTMVMKELAEPRPTYVLLRGQYDKPDKSRPAKRAVPAALGQLPEGAPANRLGLAQWMTAPGHPLVARVAVNRVWETLFGTGIVRTSEDFGMQGEWPSHPELLDWLAVDFREHGWSVKRLVREIVTSATYRQSSRARPELRESDPDNRLLASFPRRRLAAEQLRDQALYVSGLLVERFGGASVKPYQPEGLWQEVAMLQSNTRVYERGMGDDLWRRSLYTYWKRACPPPAMLTFDAPTREFCTVRRTTTNTPLQALVLWNDEQFVEAARALAARTLREAATDDERLARVFRRCTGRAPEPDELALLRAALAQFRERYRDAPDDARKLVEVGESPVPEGCDLAELAAWTLLANALLNLDATIARS